ncbi:hypothetical protein, partial [Vibrio parahaemolyticus]|uniref:hypothetical protein n=1 Tax=Vibrio parahaemolyticus TaxID=670 RepID=UPI00117524E4
SIQEGQSTRGEFGLNIGICVFGGKLKLGGSALLPLNAALCAPISIVRLQTYNVTDILAVLTWAYLF